MNARKLIVFKHNSELGNAPAHKLFDLVEIKRTINDTKPARKFADYAIKINKSAVPEDVTIEEKL